MFDALRSMITVRSNRKEIYSKPEYWNRRAIDDEGSTVSMWRNKTLNAYYEREQFAFIDGALGDVRGRTVLDIGCGTGRLSRHLSSRGARVTAFDFAEGPITIARSLDPQEAIAYRVQSVFDLDDVGAYDCAVALGNITVACKSANDVTMVLQRLHRALKPQGKLVFVEPLHDNFLKRVLALSLKEFLRLLEDNGFRVEMRRELHFWPTRLPLSLGNFSAPVTASGYYVGRMLMALGGEALGFGDYKAIAAKRID